MGKRLRRLASCETFLPFPFAVPPLPFTGAQRKEMRQAVLGM